MKRFFLALLCFLPTSAAAAQQLVCLGESDATLKRLPIYLVDETDGVTPETGVTLAGADVQVSENGAAFTNGAGSVTEIGDGAYYYVFDDTEIDAAGFKLVKAVEAGVSRVFMGYAQVRDCVTTASIAAGILDDDYTDNVTADSLGEVLNTGIPSAATVAAAVLNDDYTDNVTADSLGEVLNTGIPSASTIAAAVLNDDYTDNSTADTLGEFLNDGGGGGGGSSVAATASLVNQGNVDIFSAAISGTHTNTTSSAVTVPAGFQSGTLWVNADYTSGAGATLDITIQDSPDGTNWRDVEALNQITTSDATQAVSVTTPLFRFLRIKYTTTGTSPSYASVVVQLWGDLK